MSNQVYIAHLKRLAAMGSKDAESKLALLQPVPPAKGADGKAGTAGADGKSGAAGADGLRGSDGYPGARGEQGFPGPDGAEGPMGPQGPAGNPGTDGLPGPIGKQGLQGLPGLTGKQGLQGLQGLIGEQGPLGFRGPSGLAGRDGAAAAEVLLGGLMGQLLSKASDDDGDFEWVTPSKGSAEPSMFWAQQPPGQVSGSGITQAYADAHYDALGAADSAVATHAAAPDPHPQYLTPAEGSAAYDALGAATAAIAAHLAAGDPHPVYLTQAEGDGFYDALGAAAARVLANGAIVAGTNTKITYDAKGLVVSAVAATTADIAPSANRNYVTDAQAVVIANTSGTNTGNATLTGEDFLSIVGQLITVKMPSIARTFAMMGA